MCLLAIVAVVVLAGCRSRRSLEEVEEALGQVPPPQSPVAADALEAGFARVERLFARDATALFPPVDVDLVGRSRHDRVVEAEASRCYTFLAWSEPDGIDLDLVLTDPDGQTVAADTAPDGFPVLHAWCADVTGPHVLRASSRRGEGRARIGAYAVEDGGLAVATQRLHALRARFVPEGRIAGAVGRAFVAEGEDHDVALPLARGQCVAAVASGDGRIADLDAAWVRADGVVPVQDVGLPDVAALQAYCSESGEAVRLRLTAYEGEGVAYWQILEVDPL